MIWSYVVIIIILHGKKYSLTNNLIKPLTHNSLDPIHNMLGWPIFNSTWAMIHLSIKYQAI